MKTIEMDAPLLIIDMGGQQRLELLGSDGRYAVRLRRHWIRADGTPGVSWTGLRAADTRALARAMLAAAGSEP